MRHIRNLNVCIRVCTFRNVYILICIRKMDRIHKNVHLNILLCPRKVGIKTEQKVNLTSLHEMTIKLKKKIIKT